MVDLNCISIKLLYEKSVWPWITGAVTSDTRVETVSYSDLILIQVRLVSAILWRIKRWIKKLKAWIHAWDTEEGGSLYHLFLEKATLVTAPWVCQQWFGGKCTETQGLSWWAVRWQGRTVPLALIHLPRETWVDLIWIRTAEVSPRVRTHMPAHTSTHTCTHTELENLGSLGLH